jgi:hypothetical protein
MLKTTKKVFRLFILIIVAAFLNAQTMGGLNTKIDSINKTIEINKNKIQNINNENSDLISLRSKYNDQINKLKVKSLTGNNMICKTSSTGLYKGHEFYYKIDQLYFGDIVEIIEVYDDKYKINFNSRIGFVLNEALATKNEFDKIPNKESLYEGANLFKKAINNPKSQSIKTKEERLIEKYGKEYGPLINKKHIALGMTKNMVIESIGHPNDINKTVGSWGVHEQWVYYKRYLYFENGKLTSWQE